MTKFMQKINTVNTNERKALIEDFDFSIDMSQAPCAVNYNEATKIEFDAHFKSWAWSPSDGKALTETRRMMLEGFRREVYGEVEEHLIDIVQDLYRKGDMDTANKVRNLMKIIQEV